MKFCEAQIEVLKCRGIPSLDILEGKTEIMRRTEKNITLKLRKE